MLPMNARPCPPAPAQRGVAQLGSATEKTCSKCGTSRPLSEFNRNGARGYQAYCRSCQRDYDKTASSPERIRKRKERREQAQRDARAWLLDYLLIHPCVDCGEGDPVVLDFDHLRDKVLAVSTMLRLGYALARIRAEVAKCEVRCANCHRRMTAKRNGAWWRSGRPDWTDNPLIAEAGITVRAYTWLGP